MAVITAAPADCRPRREIAIVVSADAQGPIGPGNEGMSDEEAQMKTRSAATYLFVALVFAFTAAPAHLPAQPLWTDFTYTDWSPDVPPAIGVIGEKHYESRTVWDGTQFVSIHEYTEPGGGAKNSYWIAYSADGQTWGTPTPLPAMTDEWSVGHHAVACDPDCFPASDTMNGDTNIKFKMWYNRYWNHAYFRYAESPDGIT